MVHILLISGSTRSGSTNTAALRSALGVLPDGITAELYEGLAALPAFNPDDDHDPLPPAPTELRAAIADADAVAFCTPEYAGNMPGSLKNLLDWTVGGAEMYGKPVAWINVAMPGRGHNALAALKTVLGYVGSEVIEEACVDLPLRSAQVDVSGLVTDAEWLAQVAKPLTAIRDRITAGSAS